MADPGDPGRSDRQEEPAVSAGGPNTQRPNTARRAAIVVGVVVLGLVALFAFADDGGSDTDGNRLLGGRVPAVEGTALDGSSYDIDNARGRWVLLNFFATWCGPCIVEHPELVTLEQWGAENDQLELVSVVFDDDPDNVADLFAELGGSWPVLDSPRTVIDFQLRRVPESFLINPDGVVVAQFISGIRADQVVEAIEGS